MLSKIKRALRNLKLLALALLWFIHAPAWADAERPSQCAAAEFRQFDFWIGDWDTFESIDPSGPAIARARIKPIVQGCALHELYEQNDGLIGDSILSYDSVRKQWQQTWVTNRGALMLLTGKMKGDAITLEGDSHQRDGSIVRMRITWQVKQTAVRESAVMSKDAGKTRLTLNPDFPLRQQGFESRDTLVSD
jgi:hypothetical protein